MDNEVKNTNRFVTWFVRKLWREKKIINYWFRFCSDEVEDKRISMIVLRKMRYWEIVLFTWILNIKF